MISVETPFEGAEIPAGHVALACVGGSPRFVVPAGALRMHSEFASNLLADEGDAAVEVPLDASFATPDVVALLATWLVHRASSAPTPLRFPVPIVHDPAVLFDEWDGRFLGEVVCGPRFATDRIPMLYRLSRLATFLQVKPLVQITATLLAHFITVGVRTSGNPTGVVREWFGLEGEFTQHELNDMMVWMAQACHGMKLKRRDPTNLDPPASHDS